MKKILLSALIIALLIPSFSLASTPQTLSVQGKLTDTLNNPYTGSKNFIFRIYDSETGGTPLYTEFWNSTTQKVSLAYGGYFSVLLGTYSPLTLPFDRQYWLEMSVEGETLSPRTKLSSTPYTYRANVTENLAANTNSSGNLNMNSFNITNAGLVGIGLSSPLSLLHLFQSGSNTLFNASNGTVNAGLFIGTLSGGNAGASIGTNSNHQFRLFTGGTDRLTVDTNGYVGINTTSPNELLSIGFADSGNGGIEFKSTTYARLAKIWVNTSVTEGKLIFSTRSGGTLYDRMIIDNSGNVGIGTASPQSLLTFGTATPYVTVDTSDGSDNKRMILSGGGDVSTNRGAYTELRGNEFGAAGQGGQLRLISGLGNPTVGNGADIIFGGNSGSGETEFMHILGASGNVGIGTASPQNKLNVVGDINATGTVYSGGATTAVISTGSYTGNNAANRAIAHGLGKIPKLVIIVNSNAGTQNGFVINGTLLSSDTSTNSAVYTVTSWDATNFYVGNAGDYQKSLNGNGQVMYFVALG